MHTHTHAHTHAHTYTQETKKDKKGNRLFQVGTVVQGNTEVRMLQRAAACCSQLQRSVLQRVAVK